MSQFLATVKANLVTFMKMHNRYEPMILAHNNFSHFK